MRIIAGTFRSVVLASVGKGDAGAHLRPTTDRVRESLFGVLTSREVIEGARVLDVFAGTGALGLEALSRGASFTQFVDDGRVAQNLLKQNVAKLRVQERTHVVRRDALKLAPNDGDGFDLVFLDPPYGKGLGEKALLHIDAQGWLSDGAFVVWEDSTAKQAPDGFEVVDQRKYGDTHVTMLSKLPAQ